MANDNSFTRHNANVYTKFASIPYIHANTSPCPLFEPIHFFITFPTLLGDGRKSRSIYINVVFDLFTHSLNAKAQNQPTVSTAGLSISLMLDVSTGSGSEKTTAKARQRITKLQLEAKNAYCVRDYSTPRRKETRGREGNQIPKPQWIIYTTRIDLIEK